MYCYTNEQLVQQGQKRKGVTTMMMYLTLILILIILIRNRVTVADIFVVGHLN